MKNQCPITGSECPLSEMPQSKSSQDCSGCPYDEAPLSEYEAIGREVYRRLQKGNIVRVSKNEKEFEFVSDDDNSSVIMMSTFSARVMGK